MAFRNAVTPADTDLLCEACGYILNGLTPGAAGNCPECGEPLAMSLDPAARSPAPVELAWTAGNFWRTTARVLFAKRRFFRQTLTRRDTPAVPRFGRRHRHFAAALFGLASATHLLYMAEIRGWIDRWGIVAEWGAVFVAAAVLYAASLLLLNGVTRLAAAMTSVESRYWGMRLPRGVLRRAMDFHAANYLPVALLAALITVGYRIALQAGWLTGASGVAYLVTLCLAVVAGAVWLFESYVIAMRRIRFANF